jgi:hypothetical protein
MTNYNYIGRGEEQNNVTNSKKNAIGTKSESLSIYMLEDEFLVQPHPWDNR